MNDLDSEAPPKDACTAPVKLLLDDSTELRGHRFGALKPVRGEVVFNTAMSGYVETLTDPAILKT